MDIWKADKLLCYELLANDPHLVQRLPITKIFSVNSFRELINSNSIVFIKPSFGTRGKGIMKVSQKNNVYEIENIKKKFDITELEHVINYLVKVTSGEKYIVQSYIPLAKVNNNPFDIRVMVQRKVNSPWTITGKYAKVAKPGLFITNLSHKASVMEVENAISCSNMKKTSSNMKQIIDEIDTSSLEIVQKLSETFEDHNRWGLDIALDQNSKLWFIEANAFPGYKGFKQLKDKSIYENISALVKADQKYRFK